MAKEQLVQNNESAVQNVDIFGQFFGGENTAVEKTRDDIIAELLASPNCKRVNGLTIKNVVETKKENHTLVTFVVKEYVIGDVAVGEDQFGQPIMQLGKTHNVLTSNFAVSAVMKDDPRLAIFAQDFVDGFTKGVELFAGGTADVIMQYVPKGEEYVNPFASNPEPTTFGADKMICHVVSLTMGVVGKDKYAARIARWEKGSSGLRSATAVSFVALAYVFHL